MNNKKVLLGMSGGIDSTVCAYRLKQAGYEVIGVTFDFLGNDTIIREAKKIAEKLGIKHVGHVCLEAFSENVIKPFIDSYQKGKTPNPCLICNETMKFPLLFKMADELDCKWIATGHYAKLENSGDEVRLLRSDSQEKDQSYFLYHLSQQQLKRLILPLEVFASKNEVRKEIKALFPRISKGGESQGICFIPQNNHRRFLREKCYGNGPARKGAFLDEKGNLLGYHRGALGYTVGQTKGLDVKKELSDKNWAVLKIKVKENHVILGEEEKLVEHKVSLENFSLISKKQDLQQVAGKNDLTFKVCCKGQMIPGKIEISNEGSVNQVSIVTEAGVRAPAVGQALVVYQGRQLLGGGRIIKITED